MGKIIFLDVDGTLVDYENHLPESAVLAVRKARENGHRVYICTGRSKAEVYENIWEIGLDGMIGGNGSYVEDHGHVVMHQMITPEQCRHIVDWLKEHRLEFYLESNAGLFASAGFEEAGEPVIQEYSRRKGKEGADKIKVRDVFPEMIFDGELYRDDVDLGVKNITKGNAIAHLLEYLHADVADTIAFGDAKVDIPMLEYCGYGVAMGSGGDEIKAMADYVTGDVDQNGLYDAFEKLGLL